MLRHCCVALLVCPLALFAGDELQQALELTNEGRYVEAQTEMKRLLEESRARAGESDVRTLMIQCYLAQALNMGGRARESLDLAGPVFERFETSFGPDDPRTLVATSTFAVALRESGRYADAEKLLARAVASPALKGEDRAIALGEWATALAYRHKDKEAVRAAKEAVAVQAAAGGPASRYLYLRLTLGQILLVVGRTGEAASTLEGVERERAGIWREGHPHEGTIYAGLGIVRFRQGRLREAEQYMRSALRISESFLGPQHPELGGLLAFLAAIVEADGRPSEAKSLQARYSLIARQQAREPVSAWALRSVK